MRHSGSASSPDDPAALLDRRAHAEARAWLRQLESAPAEERKAVLRRPKTVTSSEKRFIEKYAISGRTGDVRKERRRHEPHPFCFRFA